MVLGRAMWLRWRKQNLEAGGSSMPPSAGMPGIPESTEPVRPPRQRLNRPSHTLSGSFSNFSRQQIFSFFLRFFFFFAQKERRWHRLHYEMPGTILTHSPKLCNHPGTWVLLSVAGAGAVESRQNQVQILFLTLGVNADLMLDKGMACLLCLFVRFWSHCMALEASLTS